MATLDLILAGLIMGFGILGFLSGFWMQIMRLAVFVGAYLLAGVVGGPLGPPLARGLGLSPLVGQAIASFVAFLGLYLVLSTVGWALIRRRRRLRDAKDEARARRRQRWDSLAGAGLAMLKSGLILYVVLCGLALLEEPLGASLRRADIGYERSQAVALARRHNLLAGLHLPVVGDLTSLAKLGRDPAFREKAARDPKVQRLLAHPKLQGLLGDPEVIRASESRDVGRILGNARLNQAFQDPEIRKLLSEIDLGQLE
jgi:hypothetical protein